MEHVDLAHVFDCSASGSDGTATFKCLIWYSICFETDVVLIVG